MRDRDQFFKVYATGQLVFPFSRLNAGDLFPKLVGRLNYALGTVRFAETDANRKGIGWDVAALFPNDDRLCDFLGGMGMVRSTTRVMPNKR